MSLLTVILSVISGVISSMGLGGGSILIILLTTVLEYPQRKAQGINIIFFLPCALYGILSYKKQGYILKDKVFPVIIFGLIGSTAGYFILDYLYSIATSYDFMFSTLSFVFLFGNSIITCFCTM